MSDRVVYGDLGPQTSAQQLAKTQQYIQFGKEAGARLAQEEVFGPVLSIIPFEAEEQAINDFTQTKTVVVDLSTGKPDDPFA